jgi:alkylation response protein AidB-like acyl-CoA dehydrogenase
MVRPDGDSFVANGSGTYITNGPYANAVVFVCKHDHGSPWRERAALNVVLDRGMDGLDFSLSLLKMGMYSSFTVGSVRGRRASRPRSPARWAAGMEGWEEPLTRRPGRAAARASLHRSGGV